MLLLFLTLSLLVSCQSNSEFKGALSDMPRDSSLEKSLKAHIEYLAGPELMGRETGTYGNLEAAKYIADIFAQNGLEPLTGMKASQSDMQVVQRNVKVITDSQSLRMLYQNGRFIFNVNQTKYKNLWKYSHTFDIRGKKAPPVDKLYLENKVKALNVLGLKRSSSSHRTIVIGAHFDHFGPSTRNHYADGSFRCKPLAKGSKHLVKYRPDYCYGADDNAAGVAVVLEILRGLQQIEVKKNILFVAFGAEELGDQGSQALVDDWNQQGILPPCSIDERQLCIEAMINIDLIAYANSGKNRSKLGVIGLRTFAKNNGQDFIASRLKKVEHVVVEDIVGVGLQGIAQSRTDSDVFINRNTPILSFSTDESHIPHYHKAGDLPEQIPYKSYAQVAKFIRDLSTSLVKSSNKLEVSQDFRNTYMK